MRQVLINYVIIEFNKIILLKYFIIIKIVLIVILLFNFTYNLYTILKTKYSIFILLLNISF